RMQAHATACADHDRCFARADAGPRGTRLEHGRDGVRNETRLLEAHGLRQADEVASPHCDVLGVAAVAMRTDHAAAMVVEPRAKRFAADAAVPAVAAAHVVAYDHALA